MGAIKQILVTIATCASLGACGASSDSHEGSGGSGSSGGVIGSIYSIPPNFTSNHKGPIVLAITARLGRAVSVETWNTLKESLSVEDAQANPIDFTVDIVTVESSVTGDSLSGPIPRLEIAPRSAWGSGWHVISLQLPDGLESSQLWVTDGGIARLWFRADRDPVLKRVSVCERQDGGLTAETHFTEMIDVEKREYLEGNLRVDDAPCELMWQLNNGDSLVDFGFVAELLYSCPPMRADSVIGVRFAEDAFASNADIPRLMDGKTIDLRLVIADAQPRGNCHDWITIF